MRPLMLVVVLLPTMASASSGVRTSADCPALFTPAGSSDRPHVLEEVTQTDAATVDIVHRGDFDDPVLVRVRGVRLSRTAANERGARKAILRVDDSMAGACEPGLYALRAGGFIGEMRVLAVLRKVVILQDHGRLAYLRMSGSPGPVFRMTWASPWKIERARSLRRSPTERARSHAPRKKR